MPRFLSIVLTVLGMVTEMAAANAIQPICERWERIQTPTQADLWGVYYDYPINDYSSGIHKPGLYVAVGTQGTILTSEDGSTWVAQVSGTSEWLLGVTKGYLPSGSIWVVVGDKGTILTSPDGITWTPQSSGTTERLNGVARGQTYFGGPSSFLAVGEKGTLCTSTDGVHWSVSSTGGTEWLRGVTYSSTRGAYLVSGSNGRCFLTNGGLPLTNLSSLGGLDIAVIMDVEFGYNSFLAGDASVWHLENSSPKKVLQDTSFFRGLAKPSFNANTDSLGGFSASMSAVGTQGVLGLSPRAGIDHWFSVRFPGGDNLLASYHNVSCGQAGIVWLQVDPSYEKVRLNVERSSTVPDALFEGGSLLLGPDYHNQVGLSFQWYKDGTKINGSTQPIIQINSLSAADSGTYTCAITNSDILYLWHMQVPKPLPAPPSLVTITPQTHVSDTVPQPPNSGPTGYQIDQPRLSLRCEDKVLIVSRLSAEGTIDASFQPVSIPLDISRQSSYLQYYAHTDSDGKIWVTIRAPSLLGYDGYTVLLRLLPTFQQDASFSQIVLGNSALIYIRSSYIHVEDVSIWASSATSMAAPVPSKDLLRRFHLDGTPDPSVNTDLRGTQIIARTLLQDGSLILLRQYFPWPGGGGGFPLQVNDYVPIFWPRSDLNPSYVSNYHPGPNQIARLERYSPEGVLDRDYRADLDITGTANSIQGLPDGGILIGGNIIAINGVQCGTPGNAATTVRITPDRHASSTRLVGISSRAVTGPDSETLITGFIVSGATNRSIVLSGIGPGLASQAVTSPLGSPVVTLYAGQTSRMSNDNWETFPDQQTLRTLRAKTGAFALIQGIADASAIGDITPGGYSVLITSKNARNGVALAEVYDGSDAPTSYSDGRVTGFSTRGKVGAGENAMIAGFAIDGANSKRVLICGSGPALTKLGVQGAIPSVKLSLYQGGRLLTVAYPGTQYRLMPVIDSVLGNAHLEPNSKDAAMCVTLLPGAYSIVMTGETESDLGVGMIEVFEAP